MALRGAQGDGSQPLVHALRGTTTLTSRGSSNSGKPPYDAVCGYAESTTIRDLDNHSGTGGVFAA